MLNQYQNWLSISFQVCRAAAAKSLVYWLSILVASSFLPSLSRF